MATPDTLLLRIPSERGLVNGGLAQSNEVWFPYHRLGSCGKHTEEFLLHQRKKYPTFDIVEHLRCRAISDRK